MFSPNTLLREETINRNIVMHGNINNSVLRAGKVACVRELDKNASGNSV
jgi:hypothetical protein